jgi:hypothetical protein
MWQYPSISHPSRLWPSSSYIEDLQGNLEHIRDEVINHMGTAIQRQADQYNRNRTHTIINVGDSVLVKVEGKTPGKFPKYKYQGPYQVISKNNYWSFKLKEMRKGKVIDRNYNQLRKLKGDHRQHRRPTCSKSSCVSTNRDTQQEQLEHQAAPMQSHQAFAPLPNQSAHIQSRLLAQSPQIPLQHQQQPTRSQQPEESPTIQLRAPQTSRQGRYPQREPPSRHF